MELRRDKMGFELRSYAQQKLIFNQKLNILLGEWKKVTVDTLPDHRRILVQFLQTAMSIIDEMPKLKDETQLHYEKRQASTFSGMAHLIMSHIARTENKNGVLYQSLEVVIGLKPTDEEKKPPRPRMPQELDALSELMMLKNAVPLLVAELFKEDKSLQKISNNHAFCWIKDFEPVPLTLLAIKMRSAAEETVVINGEKARKEANEKARLEAEEKARLEAEEKQSREGGPSYSLLSRIKGTLVWSSNSPNPVKDNDEVYVPSTQNQ
ncbi:hypothetical protein EAW55_05260 [Legionella jordanis]|nr:hypothetical protein EAW55_05260 [Legionella jordanis]